MVRPTVCLHHQVDIEAKLVETIASYMPILEDIKEYITVLDIVLGLAHVAHTAPIQYQRPTVLASDRAVAAA